MFFVLHCKRTNISKSQLRAGRSFGHRHLWTLRAPPHGCSFVFHTAVALGVDSCVSCAHPSRHVPQSPFLNDAVIIETRWKTLRLSALDFCSMTPMQLYGSRALVFSVILLHNPFKNRSSGEGRRRMVSSSNSSKTLTGARCIPQALIHHRRSQFRDTHCVLGCGRAHCGLPSRHYR
jgi:hypothetical protein